MTTKEYVNEKQLFHWRFRAYDCFCSFFINICDLKVFNLLFFYSKIHCFLIFNHGGRGTCKLHGNISFWLPDGLSYLCESKNLLTSKCPRGKAYCSWIFGLKLLQ